jgi:hypothetical protein
MYFDTNFGIKDLIIFLVVIGTFLIMNELKLFGLEKSVFGGDHKYYSILLFGIIFTFFNHIKF